MSTAPPRRISRRRFNQTAAAAIGGMFAGGVAPAFLRGKDLNGKLNIAVIGAAGRGGYDREQFKSENIVALCDVDAKSLHTAAAKYPNAKTFADFRKMFEHADEFDAVVIATCEHTHALATMLALVHDKHVYCEKPLTHDIWEARQVREMAASKPHLTTQMGIQIHATDNYRQVVEIIQSGAIGPVREVHCWVSRAWGLQSEEASKRNHDIYYITQRPREAETCPDWLDWELWIGPAAMRPYSSAYVPGPRWYRWWDFGNGTMSDLGSHRNDLPFWALGLKTPLTIEAFGPPAHPEIAPASMTVCYEYGERGLQPPVKVYWYQGEDKPPQFKSGLIPQWGDGCLFVGDKGMLLSEYNKHVLLPEKDFAGYTNPAPTLPRLGGAHHKEWADAVKAGRQSSANFEYSGLLTEANHLGNVAYRVGRKIQWDPQKLLCPNAPEAAAFIRSDRRKGWELPV